MAAEISSKKTSAMIESRKPQPRKDERENPKRAIIKLDEVISQALIKQLGKVLGDRIELEPMLTMTHA